MEKGYEGLTGEFVERSQKRYGENRLQKIKKRSFLKMLIGNLNDPIIKVLIIALFINIVFSLPHVNVIESIGIGTSILISSLVSTFSEYSSENAFEKLKEKSENGRSAVKRGGEVYEIDTTSVAVGDIVILEAGASVSADCTLIDGQVYVNESALTGESCEVEKISLCGKERNEHIKSILSSINGDASPTVAKQKSLLLKGSLITNGYAEAIVTSVGESTYIGKEAKKLSATTRPSPLKNRLSQLAKLISILGYIAAGVVAIAYLFNVFIIDSNFVWSAVLLKLSNFRFVFSKILSALTLAVSITVVAVPEGLPMMITVVLSSNMKKMAKDNVLVRKLVGIETSGNVNLLFTDKTGTLTKGDLRLKEYIIADGKSYTQVALQNAPKIKEYLALCANYCTNATRQGKQIIGGDITERALLLANGSSRPRATIDNKIPFDSTKKYSAVQLKYENKDIAIFKGAPEKILGASSSYIDSYGNVCPMTQAKLREISEKQAELSKKSYRIIAIGVKNERSLNMESVTFVALACLKDKIRKEVPRAIRQVKEAGVQVVMITGDSRLTAEAIAKECGIISPYSKENVVLEADTLHRMSDSEIKEILPRLAVVSRALPSDKSRLVTLSQELGYVTGMTGDGINDASSLKIADVGFAMGSGTEVAKEAGDIVIKDNNFASIVKAILYGRTIFESIRKFVVFQLIMNFSAVGISLIGPFIGVDTPVTITQMLWVNIIMDTLGALAFACEPPLEEYMKRPPKRVGEKILTKGIIKHIILVSSYILVLCVWFLKSDTCGMILSNGTEKYLLSAFFAMFIFTGVFVCFTVRTTRVNILANLSKNKYFVVIMLGILAMQIFFIYFGGEVLRTVPLKTSDLFSVLLISFTVVIFDLLRKGAERLFKRKTRKKLSINLKGKL